LKTCIFKGCTGTVTRSVGGGAGLIFKGSGFYINDYKKKGEHKNAEPAKKESIPASPSEKIK